MMTWCDSVCWDHDDYPVYHLQSCSCCKTRMQPSINIINWGSGRHRLLYQWHRPGVWAPAWGQLWPLQGPSGHRKHLCLSISTACRWWCSWDHLSKTHLFVHFQYKLRPQMSWVFRVWYNLSGYYIPQRLGPLGGGSFQHSSMNLPWISHHMHMIYKYTMMA